MLNKVILIGRVGSAEKKDSGFLNFSIATDRNFKKDDEWKTETDWHNCSYYLGDRDSWIEKGQLLYVEGLLGYWKDKEDNKHSQVIVKLIKTLSKKEKTEIKIPKKSSEDIIPF